MNGQRIYLDTSVIGGCFDAQFAHSSIELLRAFEPGTYRAVVSQQVASEIQDAPFHVRRLYDYLIDSGAEVLVTTDEAILLAAEYRAAGIVPRRYNADGLHIALATVAAVDVLVSWNFKHIVRYDKVRLFNATNEKLGYPSLRIRTPRQLQHDRDQGPDDRRGGDGAPDPR